MKTVFDSGPTLGQPLFVPHKDNFAPRIGLAWDPFGNGKTSVRAGAGVFQEQLVPSVLRYTYASMPHITRSFTLLGPGTGVLKADPNTVPPSAAGGLNYQSNPSVPERFQWSLDIQREIVSGTTVSVAYVGARGEHLQYNPGINMFTPTFWPSKCAGNCEGRRIRMANELHCDLAGRGSLQRRGWICWARWPGTQPQRLQSGYSSRRPAQSGAGRNHQHQRNHRRLPRRTGGDKTRY